MQCRCGLSFDEFVFSERTKTTNTTPHQECKAFYMVRPRRWCVRVNVREVASKQALVELVSANEVVYNFHDGKPDPYDFHVCTIGEALSSARARHLAALTRLLKTK